MNRLKAWLRSFFGFSRGETNAFLILLPLMAMVALSEPIYRWWNTRPRDYNVEDSNTLDSLVATWKWDTAQVSVSKPLPSLFPFDPNTATMEELTNLGLPDKLAHRMMNYRQKGGKFRVKGDIRKLYGMDSSLFSRLTPFIRLPDKVIFPKSLTPHYAKSGNADRFDLNLADTSQLIKLFGIGPKRSMTILKYRDRLGGFVSLDQLREVYGLDSSSLVQLKKSVFIREGFQPHQINLNTASEKELSALPYIKFKLAKTITTYRFQHGKFDSVNDLANLALMDQSLFEKIKPYLTVKDSL